MRVQPCPRCGWYACIFGDSGACNWCGQVWYGDQLAGYLGARLAEGSTAPRRERPA